MLAEILNFQGTSPIWVWEVLVSKLQVISIIDEYFKFDEVLESIYVFDDGLVSAFMEIKETEICKLYVDPFFQNSGIGSELIEFAIKELKTNHLWVLQENDKAISFYQKHGFHLTNTTMDIENTNKKNRRNEKMMV